MEYINYIKTKTRIGGSTKPVLSEEDEKFLNQITKQDNPNPLPVVDHGGDAQLAIMNGAQNVPLPPATPNELVEEPIAEQVPTKQKKSTWSWMRRDSRDSKRQSTAEGLHDIAEGLKAEPVAEETPEEAEVRREEEDMKIVLENLNLAAVDNRVFSVSEETQDLLRRFNQVLKDLMNGVPTAYRDLESLLTNGDQQIQKTYNSLPPFLQKLVEKLPETMTKGIAPEVLAAASARASGYGINLAKSGKAAGSAAKFIKTPSLKELIGNPTAITTLLKSIMQFLKTRFPAFAGINVLWSLALFLLLIVFWYCHKRGREVRLEKERVLTEKEVEQLEKEWQESQKSGGGFANLPAPTAGSTTTAPPGASMDQVRAGIIEADAARIAEASAAQAKEEPQTKSTADVSGPATVS